MSAFALPRSLMLAFAIPLRVRFRHSFESPLSHRWVLTAGPGTSVLASSPPSASPFNPEPTVRRAQSLASQLRLRAERLRGPGLADRTPPHSRPPRPSLAPHARAAAHHGGPPLRASASAGNPLRLRTLPGTCPRGASGRPSHGLRQRSALLLDSADHGTKEMRAWHLRREPDSHP